jgi:hypothetical protein
MTTPPVAPINPGTTNENVLYVILHGLISLVDLRTDKDLPEKDKGFIGYVLEMGDEHVYRFGNWLEEVEIPERITGYSPFDATLIGVDAFPGGTSPLRLDPALNLVLKLDAAPPISSPDVRAVFRLPRPRNIFHFVSGTIDTGALLQTGPAGTNLVKPPQKVSGIRIFEYTFQNSAKVALVQTGIEITADGPPPLWNSPKPAAVPNSGRNVSVLHIYDEPLHTLRTDQAIEEHNLNEFNLGFELFNSQLKLTKLPSDLVSAGQAPLGLIPGEIESLDRRSEFAISILRAVRSKDLSLQNRDGGSIGGQLCSTVHGRL